MNEHPHRHAAAPVAPSPRPAEGARSTCPRCGLALSSAAVIGNALRLRSARLD